MVAPGAAMAAIEPTRVEQSVRGRILHYSAVGSTQDVARILLQHGVRDLRGVVAEFQESGRGRLGAAWIAEPGDSLLATWVVWEHELGGLELFQLSLVAGVAVAEALRGVTGLSVKLKWPNDLMVGGRKVGGCLVEICSGTYRPRAALIGTGVNVRSESFPRNLARTAASLTSSGARHVAVSEVQVAVDGCLDAWCAVAANHGIEPVIAAWREIDDTTGRAFTALVAGEKVSGRSVGIAKSGALLMETRAGCVVEVISAIGVGEQLDEAQPG